MTCACAPGSSAPVVGSRVAGRTMPSCAPGAKCRMVSTMNASVLSDAFGGEKASAPSLEMRDVATATP